MKMKPLQPDGKYSDNTATIYIEGSTSLCSFIKQNGRAAYSNQTIAEIKKENPGKSVKVLRLDDAVKFVNAAQDDMFLSDWKEITEEDFHTALNCLPPENFRRVNGVVIFRMSEYYTSNITAHYAALGEKCYKGYFRTNSPTYDEHAKKISELTA
jgi:hypothetical protein